MKPIIVMAGTPVDTRMGMDCLSSHGLNGLFCPVSENPNQQTAFQISPMEKKAAAVTALLRTAQAEHGCGKAFIYCNSLSGSVDFGPIARETGLKIVTPLDVYRRLAPRYHSLAVIAANAQGTAGIERTLLTANPALTLRSTGLLPVVLSIEAGEPPVELVARHRLPELCGWYESVGAEALVLGCTHFPFAAGAIRRVVGPDVELLDGSAGTARETKRRLLDAGLLVQQGEGSVTIENSLDSPAILALSRQLLHAPIFPGRESFDK